MNGKMKNIDPKLIRLGKKLGLKETDVIQAKIKTKNILKTALVTIIFSVFAYHLMPGGPVGLYYTGGSIKDFQILISYFF